jgi:hypothetical protein
MVGCLTFVGAIGLQVWWAENHNNNFSWEAYLLILPFGWHIFIMLLAWIITFVLRFIIDGFAH